MRIVSHRVTTARRFKTVRVSVREDTG